ncbi:HEAT repeat domain-containing protein [Streptomyces purpureus]|nr:HEAT repeat domain-containing protein [Streptomyces purpureus]
MSTDKVGTDGVGTDGVGTDGLFEAVHGGDADAVVRLLRAGVPADAADPDGETPLYRASVSDEPVIVRLLLAAGADPDGASGEDGGELPLCGAACGGHTEVVRALLAAGAQVDLRESYNWNAMSWAVQQGHADTVEALLEHGADPLLPGANGLPPLVAAARRGSATTVRALLRHGAGATRPALTEALAEARRWIGADVEQVLRDSLVEMEGGVEDGSFEVVSRRVPEDGGITVVVEIVRDGRPTTGQEQQTGHAAIATMLEVALGIRTPDEELAVRALSCGDPELDDWIEVVSTLRARADEDTFETAAAWCASDDVLRQALGVDVLGGLGAGARAVPLLRELAREAQDEELVRAVIAALGQYGDPAALPEVLSCAGHPEPEVRRRVAVALVGMVPAGHAEAGAVLVGLSRDADEGVRDWATLALAELPDDSPELRSALADRLDDPDPDVVAEAARGLAIRQDPRAIAPLTRLLADEDPDGSARDTALDALSHIQDPLTRTRLEWTTPRYR